MPLSSSILFSLQSAGLEAYARRLSGLEDAAFLSMLMNDYATYGVVDVEDKQKLFRYAIVFFKFPTLGAS